MTGSFTDGKPRVATEGECKAKWRGGNNGKYFRCSLCKHKFAVGDYWRFQYIVNSLNLITCRDCDTPDLIVKWSKLKEEFYSDKFWVFRAPIDRPEEYYE